MNTKRRTLLLAALLVGSTLVPGAPARGANFVVDSGADTADADTSDGVCADASGRCTLRAALNQAFFSPGRETIAFAVPGDPPVITLEGTLVAGNAAVIDGTTQPGYAGTPLVRVEPGVPGSPGIVVFGSSTEIRGLELRGFTVGIDLSGGTGYTVAGNVLRDNGMGVQLSSSDTTIGGPAPADANLIDRSTHTGIKVNALLPSGAPTSGNRIEGNTVGWGSTRLPGDPGVTGILVDGDGHSVVGNIVGGNTAGIALRGRSTVAARNRVGTDAAGSAAVGNVVGMSAVGEGLLIEDNLVSGNTQDGMQIAATSPVVVRRNLVGTDPSGTTAVPNTSIGVYAFGGAHVIDDNVLSGNGRAGAYVVSAADVTVSGNRIGTDASGAIAIANGTGVEIVYSSGTQVTGNLIAGNTEAGVLSATGSSATVVGDNRIGAGGPLGNDRGVVFTDGDGSVIGNTVAYNVRQGVAVVEQAAGVTIRGNAIHSNGGLGIDLHADGPTPNDPLDHDGGPNRLQNLAELASALDDGTVTVTGLLRSAASRTYTVDLYASDGCDPAGYGEGARPLGSVEVTTDADGDAVVEAGGIAAVPGEAVTATATGPDGDTSEFSACVDVRAPSADLELSADAVPVFRPQTPGTYTFELRNAGPDAAAGASISVDLPEGTELVAIEAGAASCEGGVCTFDAGIAPGTVVPVRADVAVDAQHGAELCATASAAASTADPDPDDDTATSCASVRALADLALSSSGPSVVRPSDAATYLFEVDDLGPDAATGVRVAVGVPQGMEVTALDAEGGACDGSACSFTGGPAGPVRAHVLVGDDVAYGAQLCVSASVTSASDDPVPDNDTAATCSVVDGSADLTVAVDGPSAVRPDDDVVYTLDVTNGGPDAARAVSASLTLPPSATFVGADAPGAVCSELDGTVSCVFAATFEPDAAGVVEVAARIDPDAVPGSNVCASASVGADTPDPDPSSNVDERCATVVPGPADDIAEQLEELLGDLFELVPLPDEPEP